MSSNLNNFFPAGENEVAIFQKSQEFPTDKVVITFGNHTGQPLLMVLNVKLGNLLHCPNPITVPAHADAQTLVNLACSLPLPFGVRAIKGTGPDAGSVLFLADTDLFLGFRLMVATPDRFGSVRHDPSNSLQQQSFSFRGTVPEVAGMVA